MRFQGTDFSFDRKNVDSICSSLDDLLTSAHKANKYAHYNKLSSDIFQTKISAGIMRLRRLNERELADFYQVELKKVKQSNLWKKAAPYVFMLGLLLFLLAMIKFTSGMQQESNPVQDWLNGK